MTPITIGLLALGAFFLLMLVGVPIPFAMLIGATGGLVGISGVEIASQIMVQEMFNTFTNYAFTVGPIFGLMGFLASFSGIGSNLFNAVNSFIGHKRGGLAMATQIACAGFGAICGSPPAPISTFCAIAYPEMRKKDYSPSLAGTTIASGSALAVLIPPSGTLIIYGILTDNSIGRLFMSGILPGILLCVLNIVAIVYIGRRHPDWAPTAEKSSWKERIRSLTHGGLLEIIFVFILSMGGMFAGFFTPTEAGAVGAFGMFICTLFGKRMNFKKFLNSLLAGVRMAAMLYMLLATSAVFGKLFTLSTIGKVIGTFVGGLTVPGWVVIMVIMFIYFILGMLVDLLPMMIVTMPIFYPIVVDYLGYNPLWWGIMLTVLVMLGSLTPPFAASIFLVKGAVNDPACTLPSLFRGVWPFVISFIVCMFILLLVPSIPLILPTLLF